MIDTKKKYTLQNGRKVVNLEFRPFTPDGQISTHPIKGWVDFSDINGKKKRHSKQAMQWTNNGTYYIDKKSNFDLTEVM